jgi:hypothetical protein
VSQEGVGAQDGGEAVRQELQQLRERAAAIREEASADVDRKWGSTWRSPAVFNLKVQARLSGNAEYRSLQGRIRDAEARLAAQGEPASEA